MLLITFVGWQCDVMIFRPLGGAVGPHHPRLTETMTAPFTPKHGNVEVERAVFCTKRVTWRTSFANQSNNVKETHSYPNHSPFLASRVRPDLFCVSLKGRNVFPKVCATCQQRQSAGIIQTALDFCSGSAFNERWGELHRKKKSDSSGVRRKRDCFPVLLSDRDSHPRLFLDKGTLCKGYGVFAWEGLHVCVPSCILLLNSFWDSGFLQRTL